MTKQNDKPKSWISFRVKHDEYNKIHSLYSKTNCKKLSEYARKVLLQKPVVIVYRNQTAEDFLLQMNKLKNDLEQLPKDNIENKIDDICLLMDKIYDQWSQK